MCSKLPLAVRWWLQCCSRIGAFPVRRKIWRRWGTPSGPTRRPIKQAGSWKHDTVSKGLQETKDRRAHPSSKTARTFGGLTNQMTSTCYRSHRKWAGRATLYRKWYAIQLCGTEMSKMSKVNKKKFNNKRPNGLLSLSVFLYRSIHLVGFHLVRRPNWKTTGSNETASGENSTSLLEWLATRQLANWLPWHAHAGCMSLRATGLLSSFHACVHWSDSMQELAQLPSSSPLRLSIQTF